MQVCCAHDREQTGSGGNQFGGNRNRASGAASPAVLSQLLRPTHRARLQAELSALRILFELLRFLLIGFTLCAPVPSVVKAVEFPARLPEPSSSDTAGNLRLQ